MEKDEKFVGAHWEYVELCKHEATFWVILGSKKLETRLALPNARSAEEAMSAAAEFTREQLESIRLIEEEIAIIQGDLEYERSFHAGLAEATMGARRIAAYERTLVRLQDALKSLQQGMTDGKEGV